jgi:UPF0288 family protein (methanogenesis marker protein 3)
LPYPRLEASDAATTVAPIWERKKFKQKDSILLTSKHEEGNMQFSFLEIELPLLDKGKFSLYIEAREQKTDLSDRICFAIEIQ